VGDNDCRVLLRRTISKRKVNMNNSERTKCEIWTRVMGYHRPIKSFNPGKQSEHAERVYFKEK